MARLTFIERQQLEKLFDMGGGYVLDFSNRTFAEFVADSGTDQAPIGDGSRLLQTTYGPRLRIIHDPATAIVAFAARP